MVLLQYFLEVTADSSWQKTELSVLLLNWWQIKLTLDTPSSTKTEREESERIQLKIYLVNRNEDKNTTYVYANKWYNLKKKMEIVRKCMCVNNTQVYCTFFFLLSVGLFFGVIFVVARDNIQIN